MRTDQRPVAPGTPETASLLHGTIEINRCYALMVFGIKTANRYNPTDHPHEIVLKKVQPSSTFMVTPIPSLITTHHRFQLSKLQEIPQGTIPQPAEPTTSLSDVLTLTPDSKFNVVGVLLDVSQVWEGTTSDGKPYRRRGRR